MTSKMLENLSKIKESLSPFMEEAAAAKAKIVIVKGGTFAEEEEDSMSPMSLLAQSGLPQEMLESTMADFQSMQENMGVDLGPIRGYMDKEEIKVQMNPNSYTIKSDSNFKSEKMGGTSSDTGTFGTFGPARPRMLSVKLFYDTMLQGDYLDKLKNSKDSIVSAFTSLTSASGLMDAGLKLMNAYQKFNGKEDLNKLYLDKLLGLTRILKEISTPPLISFQYGSTTFEGYAKNVSVEYQRFNKVGEVIRAEVTLSVEESNQYGTKKEANTAGAQTPSIGSTSSVLPNQPI